jgi:hypothetical protein
MTESIEPLDYGDSPYGIEDIEIIAHGGGFSAGISFDAPDDSRKNILAAALARQFGLRSVDYTRKTYVEPHYNLRPERPEWLTKVIDITEESKRLVYTAADRAYRIRNKPDHVGLFAAGAALLRLPITFRTATLTIRNGFHFESALLLRLIVEQLAWIVSVRELTNADLFEVDPHKCVSSLKEILPSMGRLYGELSRAAHIVPQTTLRYLDFSIRGDPWVKLLTFEHAVDDALWLLLLADAYCVVSELVYRNLLPSLMHVVVRPDGSVVASSERPGVALLAKWDNVENDASRSKSL